VYDQLFGLPNVRSLIALALPEIAVVPDVLEDADT
jgi:hypothetical protein